MMAMIYDLAQSPQGQAFGQALLHFLWQGTLLGLIAAVTLQMMRRSASRTRYAVACGFFLTMALAPAITFLALLPKGPMAASMKMVPIAILPEGMPFDVGMGSTVRYAVLVWSAGVLFFGLRAIGGWFVALRQVRTGRWPANEGTQLLVREIAGRLGVKSVVRVFESARAGAPFVFGAIRPILVLPASALTGLTAAQLEAVLVHELAHVARHDFLTNCLQAAIEVVLFYHPAVWWLSAKIREERELCCDAVALRMCGDGVMYSRALLRLEESRQSLALAATGGNLKKRIERLLQPTSNSHVAGTHIAPVLLLAILIGCAAWPNQHALAMQSADSDEVTAERKRRATYANERFGSTNHPGTATARGAIYLQYGPPAEIESHPAEKREVWRYSNGSLFFFEGDHYELQKSEGPPPIATTELRPEFPAGPDKRIRVGGNAMAAKLVSKPVPLYPVAAKAQRVQGKVRLAVLVGKDGSVKDLYVLQGGPAGLTEAAEEAVRRWVYEPTLLNGEPVEVATVVDVNFTLAY